MLQFGGSRCDGEASAIQTPANPSSSRLAQCKQQRKFAERNPCIVAGGRECRLSNREAAH